MAGIREEHSAQEEEEEHVSGDWRIYWRVQRRVHQSPRRELSQPRGNREAHVKKRTENLLGGEASVEMTQAGITLCF